MLDITGKKSGRGAYVCPDPECLKKARKSRALERAFDTAIPAEVYDALEGQMDGDCDRAFVIHFWVWRCGAGAVAVGEEPVGAAARAKKARVIFTARDAAASSVRRAYSFGRAGSCLCLPFPADKEAFGRALGRTSVAMCAVTDIGLRPVAGEKAGGGGAGDLRRGGGGAGPEGQAGQGTEGGAATAREEPAAGQAPRSRRQAAGAAPRVSGASGTEARRPAPEHRRPPRREYPEGRPDRVYKERSGRPPRDKRPAKKEAPGARYENARPVKKGKGSRKTTGR